jgi:hypothetical protein
MLEQINKLQNESLSLFYNIKHNNYNDLEEIGRYIELNKQIKEINRFLLENVINKEYHIELIPKGFNNNITRIYSEINNVPKDLSKLDYSFF